ncbi:TraR/DksA family transcriptional regulator [Vibrio parahaemolyticus]|nr:TraR/DksA family transcriptional regulator [Vibrio parahaemolyticus]EHD2278995.1 TraR/DksA family transcriptional regulator [Vibrio parahaemolyticus]EHH2498549.1 TraR/DksA family transcriptional regulator [Vibrio parahaemolyticus]EHR0875076.1 TraR/DksA C4-type zinc finger protein [Vibrio parahaemolyticus]EID4328909.1 TraR/DksA C4-type zinc finger protein [Vibrio parahaemolyticus]
MNKTFSSFKEASEYAKKMAMSGLCSVKCTPCSDGSYEVTVISPAVHSPLQPDENSSLQNKVAVCTQKLITRETLKEKAQTEPKVKIKPQHPKKISVTKPGHCTQCGKKIPKTRLEVAPNTKYCVPCLSAIEQENPNGFLRSVDVDGIGGSRQDAKRTLRNRHR